MVFFHSCHMVRSSGESVGVIVDLQFVYELHVIVGSLRVPTMDLGWKLLQVLIILQIGMVHVYQDQGFFWGVFEQIAPVAQSVHNSEIFPIINWVVPFGGAECL